MRIHHKEMQTIVLTASRRSHPCYFIAADHAVWNRRNPLLQIDQPRPQGFSAFRIDYFDWREHGRHIGGNARQKRRNAGYRDAVSIERTSPGDNAIELGVRQAGGMPLRLQRWRGAPHRRCMRRRRLQHGQAQFNAIVCIQRFSDQRWEQDGLLSQQLNDLHLRRHVVPASRSWAQSATNACFAPRQSSNDSAKSPTESNHCFLLISRRASAGAPLPDPCRQFRQPRTPSPLVNIDARSDAKGDQPTRRLAQCWGWNTIMGASSFEPRRPSLPP